MDSKNTTTFRFKFCDDLVSKIDYFSKLHSLDERKVYKEEWNKWIQTNEMVEIINDETERLRRLGCFDDINEKMYRSSRYYFRKKKETGEKTRSTFVRSNINVTREFMKKIQDYIKENRNKENFSPKKSFEDFKIEFKDDYDKEIRYLCENSFSIDDSNNKIKKTYKNQHFQIVNLDKLN